MEGQNKLYFNNESIIIMLASEEVLKKDWDNKLDERWDNFKEDIK